MNIRERFLKMKEVSFPRDNGEQGSTLVIVLIMMSTMLAIAIGAINITQLNVSSSGAHKKGKQAFYAAEVSLDTAVNAIVQEFEDFSVYTTTAAKGGTPGISDTYNDHDIYYNITNPLDRYLYRTIVGNGTIFHYAYTFDIEATATSQTDLSKETLNETIRILETPLVQYFAFYAGQGDVADLELYPGAGMTIWGRMHANRDMYLTARNNGDIIVRNFDNANNFSPHFLTMGGRFRGVQKHNTGGATWTDTDVMVRTNNNATFVNPPSAEYREVPMLIDSANEVTEEANFNDYVLVNERSFQAPGQIQFWRGGFYEGKADNPGNPRIDSMTIIGSGPGATDIRVWVSRPTRTEVTTEIMNGTLINAGGTMTAPIKDTAFSTTAPGANYLYDRREGKRVDFTDIDLNLLGLWYEDYMASEGITWAGDGMLIFVSRSPLQAPPAAWANAGTNLQAIRLRQMGASQPRVRERTTVATDNPIYVMGDFNTVSTVGVALVSDATNILSNNFNNKNGPFGAVPGASNTTVNAAFFSGVSVNQEDGPVGPNGERMGGGMHNYARLHENWGNANTLNFNGSFIALWQSSQASSPWCHWSPLGCYLRPSRQFGWDVNFQNPDYWPPFIPSIFSVERVGFLEG